MAVELPKNGTDKSINAKPLTLDGPHGVSHDVPEAMEAPQAFPEWRPAISRHASSYPGQFSDELTKLSPEEVKASIRLFHALNEKDSDTNDDIDKMLFGKTNVALEREIFGNSGYHHILRPRFTGEEPWNGLNPIVWTPYDQIRSMLKLVNLTADDTFYDLGGGYGRVALYAGITTDATCKMIELVEERAQVAQQAQKRHGLSNVEIISGNVLDADYSDGNVFYMFKPFSKETFKKVMQRLEEIAQEKPVTIISRAELPYEQMRSFHWSNMIHSNIDIAIFKSDPPATR